jgi:hypothetical protein
MMKEGNIVLAKDIDYISAHLDNITNHNTENDFAIRISVRSKK